MGKGYSKVGTVKNIDGVPYYILESDGNDAYFKDEEIYEKDMRATCYVPYSDETIIGPDGNEYDSAGEWYSHLDLLDLCHRNKRMCNNLFKELDGLSPETYLNEYDEDDIIDYWNFVKKGTKVYWNDPNNKTNGVYEVYDVPPQEEWSEETIVLIGNGYLKTEVCVVELSEIEQ